MSYVIETPVADKLAIYKRGFLSKQGRSIIFCSDGIIILNKSLDKVFRDETTEVDKTLLQ